jgi:hypothetical protein
VGLQKLREGRPESEEFPFRFALKNPHNLPARRFALKAEKKDEAIKCNSKRGPDFSDLAVQDNRSTTADSSTGKFGSTSTNDTGLVIEEFFFTGSKDFQVKEIEVFEIGSSDALKACTLSVPARKLESRILWDPPAIFEKFRDQRFTLLWRGNRDGFGGRDFHKRCDGYVNPLTVMLDAPGRDWS